MKKKKKKTKVLYTEKAELICKGDVAIIEVRELRGLLACGVDEVEVRIVGRVSDKKRAKKK